MNDLVAPPEAGKPISEFYTDIMIVGPISREAEAIQSGDCFGEIASGVAIAADVVATLIDPIAALGASVASILLDYMPPLVQMLDVVAGNPEAVTGIARTWSNISEQVATSKQDLDRATARATQNWSGPASDAYRTMGESFGGILDAIAQACSAVSAGFEVASAIVKLVREIVKQLIADLVGQLISAVVEVLATVGVGIGGVVAQAVVKIAKYAAKAKKWLNDLTIGITGFLHAANKINEIVTVATPKLSAAVEGIHFVTIGGGIDAIHDAWASLQHDLSTA